MIYDALTGSFVMKASNGGQLKLAVLGDTVIIGTTKKQQTSEKDVCIELVKCNQF